MITATTKAIVIDNGIAASPTCGRSKIFRGMTTRQNKLTTTICGTNTCAAFRNIANEFSAH